MLPLLVLPYPEGHTDSVKEDLARFWDERYRQEETPPQRGPASFLMENLHLLLKGGHALDVAMGTGRNALFLASLGYRVTGIDISRVAVERCRAEARRRGLHLEAVCADLTSYPLPREAFQVVLDFYYLDRALCPRLVEALQPGGVLVFETFTLGQLQFGWGPKEKEYLLQPGELRGLFPELEIVVYREATAESQRGPKAVASLVAKKPQA